MIESATPIFLNVFEAIFTLFAIMVFSGFLVRKGIIKQVHIEAASHITIAVLLPCLMISKILLNFNPSEFPKWWIIPLVAVAMIGLGIALGKLLFFKSFKEKQNLVAVGAFMNANYMVLPIGQMLFPNDFDRFATLCFLFILGVNPTLWSIGKQMVTKTEGQKSSIKGLLTPPLVATASSVIIVLIGLGQFIPKKVIVPVEFLGSAAIPVATFILGATLGSINIKKRPAWIDLIKINFIKLIAIPGITISVFYYTGWFSSQPLLLDLLVLQSAVAPATQLVIQIKKYGGDVEKVGNMMLSAYTLCLITIPFWFTLWKLIQ